VLIRVSVIIFAENISGLHDKAVSLGLAKEYCDTAAFTFSSLMSLISLIRPSVIELSVLTPASKLELSYEQGELSKDHSSA
jgi:hypothetical protein